MRDFLSQCNIEEAFKWVFNECRYDLFGSTAGKFTIYMVSAELNTSWKSKCYLREMEN